MGRTDGQTAVLTDRQTDRQTVGWGGLIDRLIDRLVDRLMDILIDRLIERLMDRLMDRLIDRYKTGMVSQHNYSNVSILSAGSEHTLTGCLPCFNLLYIFNIIIFSYFS